MKESKKGSFTCICKPICFVPDDKAISECHRKESMKTGRKQSCATTNTMTFTHTDKPYTTTHSGHGDRFWPRLLHALPSFDVANSTVNEGKKKVQAFSVKNFTESPSGYNSITLISSPRVLHPEDLPTVILDSTNVRSRRKSVRNTCMASVTVHDTVQEKDSSQISVSIASGKLRRPVITTPSRKPSCRSSFQKSSTILSEESPLPCAGSCNINEYTILVSCKLCETPQQKGSVMEADLRALASTSAHSNPDKFRVTSKSSIVSLNTVEAAPFHAISSQRVDKKNCQSSTDHSFLLESSQQSHHDPLRVEYIPIADDTKSSSIDMTTISNIHKNVGDGERYHDITTTSITYDSMLGRRTDRSSSLKTEFHCASGIVEILPVGNSISDLGLISTSDSCKRRVSKQEDAIEKKELQQFAARYYKRIQVSLGCWGRPQCSATDGHSHGGEDSRRASGSTALIPNRQLITHPALRLPAFVATSSMTLTASRSRRSLCMSKFFCGRSPSPLS
ncbi:unnamed protein product [Phytomonas sp. Hart1]|nr:unnamed protein product [Phytomonas sp. Hart1]|eukprot:CCW67601.1 unnamed protein product [Phytomonas sp. isolate Hart1]